MVWLIWSKLATSACLVIDSAGLTLTGVVSVAGAEVTEPAVAVATLVTDANAISSKVSSYVPVSVTDWVGAKPAVGKGASRVIGVVMRLSLITGGCVTVTLPVLVTVNLYSAMTPAAKLLLGSG